MNGLRLDQVAKSFGGKTALDQISFDVGLGEVVAVLGPSGCGKSTLLNLIAGLDNADTGEIFWNGKSMANVPTHQRGFGLMFQDYALFPHRNVGENVAFGLKMARLPANQVKQRVNDVLELVGLPKTGGRDVNTLSGGEQQRVALARSLAPQPKLLMLDEPLGSLDRALRERLVDDLRQLLRQEHLTAIYVTHDQEEAFVLADRVVVLNAGRIEQIGTAQQIYQSPASIFVARFLGLDNLISGTVVVEEGQLKLMTKFGNFPLSQDYLAGEVKILLRPDAVRLDGKGDCQFTATISAYTFRGNSWQISVTAEGESLRFEIPAFSRTQTESGVDIVSRHLPEIGDPICLSFDPALALQIFPFDGNK